MKKIDKKLEKEIVEAVKKGESYNILAKQHNISSDTIKKICITHGVTSKHSQISDDRLIEAVKKLKVAKVSDVSKQVGQISYKNMRRRLDTLCTDGRIIYTTIPSTQRANKIDIFDGYIGTSLYFCSRQDFEEWVIERIPKRLPPSFKRILSHRINHLGINVNLSKKTSHITISFPDYVYNKIKKKAQEKNLGIKEYIINNTIGIGEIKK